MWEFFGQLVGAGGDYLSSQETGRQQRLLMERREELRKKQSDDSYFQNMSMTKMVMFGGVGLILLVVTLKITKVI